MYEKNKEDDRHASANLRNYEPISERVFPSWHMGFKDVSGNDAGFSTGISRDEKNAFTQLLEDEVPVSDRGIRVLKLFFEVD